MRLRGWSIMTAAKRLVLHRNTLSRWRRKFLNGEDVGGLFGPAPFNKLGDADEGNTRRVGLPHRPQGKCPLTARP